jgi:hypothetical protein
MSCKTVSVGDNGGDGRRNSDRQAPLMKRTCQTVVAAAQRVRSSSAAICPFYRACLIAMM